MQEAQALVHALTRNLDATLVETPISWVLLAGDTAFKLKKPLALPFLDYSTLAARRRCCEEEVRLNRRTAPGLYLGVARITGPRSAPAVDGAGRALEYAVRMRRFDEHALLGSMLRRGELAPQTVDRVAQAVAAFHTGAAPVPLLVAAAAAKGTLRRALGALDGVRGLAAGSEALALANWFDARALALVPLWLQRAQHGCVRDGHGDLHLDNIVMLDGEPVLFDAIEFNAALRCIDVAEDMAFTFMDLYARGEPGLAWRFVNGWLDWTGDHDAVPLLSFATAYRALVRAQVERARGNDAAARSYLAMALRQTRPASPVLYIMHGLPGSGKTRASTKLLETVGAVRLRSDVERKRLFGLALLEDSRQSPHDIYSAQATRDTYDRLLQLAAGALAAGHSAIVDAAFLKREERARARDLANHAGVPFCIISCEAPLPVLRERLAQRRGDASEADAAVLDRLRRVAEPIAADESAHLFHPG